MPSDPASAARRVAEDIRLGRHSLPDDLDAIKPLLDAVAASGGPKQARVERWARAMCADAGVNPDMRSTPSGAPWWTGYVGRAEQAIALADAERAAAAAEGWRAYEKARDLICDNKEWFDAVQEHDMKASLDAAVRRLAGMG